MYSGIKRRQGGRPDDHFLRMITMAHRISGPHKAQLFSTHDIVLKGGIMSEKRLHHLLKSIKDAVKDIDLKEGDIISYVDENYRLRMSPYRLTMEIRFPEGIHNSKK